MDLEAPVPDPHETMRGQTMRAAVLGSPIGHSLSPVLHAAAYDALGLPWTYTACEVSEETLPAFLAGLDQTWAGLSLTMPLKRAVLPLLHATSPLAAAVQAANTVVPGAGGWAGDNTDVPGMSAALAEAGMTRVTSPVLLGAGATARSALAALQQLGASEARVVARDPRRAHEVLAVAERLGMTVRLLPWSIDPTAVAAWADADVVISTTPAGATDDFTVLVSALPVPPRAGSRPVLFDVVYAPWPTALARAWAAGGGRVISGFELLIHQAALQVQLMTGRPCASLVLPAMRSALSAAHEHYSYAPQRPM